MRIGGSLEQSLSQGYRLDLKGVLQESWQQTRRTGFGLLLAIVGVTSIWMLLSNTLLAPYVNQEGGMDIALVLSLLITIMMAPMTSSLDMLGLPLPGWLADEGTARFPFVVMSLFQIGEGFGDQRRDGDTGRDLSDLYHIYTARLV